MKKMLLILHVVFLVVKMDLKILQLFQIWLRKNVDKINTNLTISVNKILEVMVLS